MNGFGNDLEIQIPIKTESKLIIGHVVGKNKLTLAPPASDYNLSRENIDQRQSYGNPLCGR